MSWREGFVDVPSCCGTSHDRFKAWVGVGFARGFHCVPLVLSDRGVCVCVVCSALSVQLASACCSWWWVSWVVAPLLFTVPLQ